MSRKEVLERRRQRLEQRRTELMERSRISQDVNEVRSINEQLHGIADDLQDVADELRALADEGNNNNNGSNTGSNNDDGANNDDGSNNTESRSVGIPTVSNVINGNIIASYAQNTQQRSVTENIFDTLEYRNAFATYVRTGDDSGFAGLEQRAADDGMVLTTDVGKIIPNTIMNEVIKELKVYGTLFNRVRKLNVKGGVEFPIQDLVPTVKWITEKNVSDNQSAPELKNSVIFAYHIVEARLAQSLLSSVVSLDYLESEIAKLLAEAFVKEFDNVVINGTGSGQPLGILNDTRVKADNKIAFTEAEIADWTKFRKKFFAKIPLAYRGQGMIVTTASTWESYFMTLTDNNNNPIGKETFNVTDGTTTCSFAGREVQLVEADIIKDFDSAAAGEAFAIYFRPQDYAVNTNMQLGFKRYYDEDNNKYVNKGLCIMDGKLLDVNGVFVLTK